jgi:hypothetical protein
MATDVGCLAPGLDGRVARLGIERKGFRRETLVVVFFGALTCPE